MQNLFGNSLNIGAALGLGGLSSLGDFDHLPASKRHDGPRGSWATKHSSGTRQRRRRQLERRTGRR